MFRSSMYVATEGSFFRFRTSCAAAATSRRLPASRSVTASASERRPPARTPSRMSRVWLRIRRILPSGARRSGSERDGHGGGQERQSEDQGDGEPLPGSAGERDPNGGRREERELDRVAGAAVRVDP